MADAYDYVQPLRSALVPLPAAPQDGVCGICHSSAGSGWSTCKPCSDGRSLNPPELLPITMSVNGGLIHRHLWSYKNDTSESVRDRCAMRLAALLSIFMTRHAQCVGEWEVVTCVPSVARVAMAPVVKRLRVFYEKYVQVLASTPEAAGRSLNPDQFEVTSSVQGIRVLLLDDTFTSGSKLFSATAALRKAGAAVVGPVVLGRHAQSSWPPTADLLDWLAKRQWNEQRCCRCNGERRREGALF